MSIVSPLLIGAVSRGTTVALERMDAVIVAAINDAKDAGVPQGLIVALLQGFAHSETADMVNEFRRAT